MASRHPSRPSAHLRTATPPAVHSAQEATFSAGGLALALAYLSLEGAQRAQNAPPLVAARSAGLLARLAQHPPALEAMSRPGVVERIMKVRRHLLYSLLGNARIPVELTRCDVRVQCRSSIP